MLSKFCDVWIDCTSTYIHASDWSRSFSEEGPLFWERAPALPMSLPREQRPIMYTGMANVSRSTWDLNKLHKASTEIRLTWCVNRFISLTCLWLLIPPWKSQSKTMLAVCLKTAVESFEMDRGPCPYIGMRSSVGNKSSCCVDRSIRNEVRDSSLFLTDIP